MTNRLNVEFSLLLSLDVSEELQRDLEEVARYLALNIITDMLPFELAHYKKPPNTQLQPHHPRV